jgi:hypothetical protein
MSARTAATNKTQLHLAAEPHHNPYADYNADIQDLFSHAMDRALGIQKASLAAVVKMQSDVIEMQKHAFDAEPAFGNIIDTASQMYATCLEIQLSWLKMMVSCAKEGADMWVQLAATGTALSTGSAIKAQPEMMPEIVEEAEESIPYGVGAA